MFNPYANGVGAMAKPLSRTPLDAAEKVFVLR
jgi:hypothetical protein